MWKQKPLAEISLGKQVTMSPVHCSLPDLWMATNHLAMQTEMLDICPFATVPGYAKGQTHSLQTLTHFSLPQAGLVPTEGMRDHRQHPPGCSALSYSTGCSVPWRRELTIRKVKEQLLNLLSSTPDSQLLPKKRSLARKGKTRNWA